MAKLNLGVSPTSVILRVKLLNSSVTTGAGLTGLTSASAGLIISTIQAGEASATAYTVAGSTIETITTLGTYETPTATKCRFKEVDATNHKGIYEIHIADARFASTSSVLVSISGATNLAECDIEVQMANLAANMISVAGTAQTAGDLKASLNTIDDFLDTEMAATLAAVDTEVAAIKAVTDQMAQAVKTITEGTCDAGSTTTSVVASSTTPASGVNDQFNGLIMAFAEDTTTVALRGQKTDVTDYVHATKTFTVTALTTAPAAGDTFTLS